MPLISKDSLAALVLLGVTGLASTLALLALASNRIPGISADHATDALLAIQWHIVGVTLSKFGVDYALFTVVSRNPEFTHDQAQLIRFPVLPCVAGFLVLSLLLFQPLVALLVSAAAFFDTLSTFMLAVRNAKRAFHTVAVGNLLNYPIFVVLLAGAASFVSPSLELTLALFLFTSVLRYCWLLVSLPNSSGISRTIALTGVGKFGAQGVLNLALFRLDQTALVVALFSSSVWHSGLQELGQYLFLARFPEFATGILVLIGTVFFPRYHFAPPNQEPHHRGREVGRVYLLVALACLAFALVAILGGRYVFAGPVPPILWCVPFVVQIPLILLANVATYSMQSQGYVNGLLRNLALAIAAGTVPLTIGIATGSLYALAWTVPLQLATYVGLTRIVSWGSPTRLYEVRTA